MVTRRGVVAGGGALAAATVAGLASAEAAMSYEEAVRAVWAPLKADGGARELVRAATLAANSHNTQPWLFRLAERSIVIAPDPSRRCPAVDPDDHHVYASLGCAAENMVQAASVLGLAASPQVGADGSIAVGLEKSAPVASPLADAIVRRQSTRVEYDGRAAGAEALRALEAAGQGDGVALLLITDRPRIDRVLDLVVAGNTAQMRDQAFMAELKAWLRFSDADAVAAMDGLFSRASGNPALPAWLAKLLLPFVFTEKGENDKYARHIRSSAGLAVFVSARDDRAHWIAVGRACQRFALQATALGLTSAFVNQAVEVPRQRTELQALLGLGDRRPDLVLRFGRGPELPRSLRRPVDAVIG